MNTTGIAKKFLNIFTQCVLIPQKGNRRQKRKTNFHLIFVLCGPTTIAVRSTNCVIIINFRHSPLCLPRCCGGSSVREGCDLARRCRRTVWRTCTRNRCCPSIHPIPSPWLRALNSGCTGRDADEWCRTCTFRSGPQRKLWTLRASPQRWWSRRWTRSPWNLRVISRLIDGWNQCPYGFTNVCVTHNTRSCSRCWSDSREDAFPSSERFLPRFPKR